MLRQITGCKEGSQFGVSLSFPALVGQTWLTLVQVSAGVCNPALCGAVWQRAQDPLKCLEHRMKSGLRSEESEGPGNFSFFLLAELGFWAAASTLTVQLMIPYLQ